MQQSHVKRFVWLSVAILCCTAILFGGGLFRWFHRIRHQADQIIGERVIDSYRQEQLDMRDILLSIRAYKASYGQLPFATNTPQEIDNGKLVSILTGRTNDAQVARRNPKGIKFLTVPESSLKDGKFVDSWGHPYRIFYDPKREIGATPGISVTSTSIMVWSDGPNGINEYGHGDDLLPQNLGSQ